MREFDLMLFAKLLKEFVKCDSSCLIMERARPCSLSSKPFQNTLLMEHAETIEPTYTLTRFEFLVTYIAIL